MNAVASFIATIAYGWLALACLFVAGLVNHSRASITCSLLAMGAAYLSQSFTTDAIERDHMPALRIAVALQVVCVVLFVVGLINL